MPTWDIDKIYKCHKDLYKEFNHDSIKEKLNCVKELQDGYLIL